MARIPQPIQLQNYIPTWKRGKETRRPHPKARRRTYRRRKKTGEKIRYFTTKGNILGHTRRQRHQNRRNGASRISGQRRREDTTSIRQRRRNPGHQAEPGKQRQRDERSSL